MSLRILQIMNRVPWPLKDGGSLGYYNYTKGYAENGCSVTVVALNTSKHYVKQLPKELEQLAQWHLLACDTSVRPLHAFANILAGNTSYQMQRFYKRAFADMLIGLLKHQTFDVIVFESLFVASYLKDIKPYTKALLVLREHNIEFEIWDKLAAGCKNPIRKWYMRHLANRIKSDEVKALKLFDAYTAVTTYDAAKLKQMGCAKPILVSAAGMDLQALKPSIKAQSGCIAFIGSLEWLPNQEAVTWFVKNVWPLVKNHPKLISCEIAGRNMPVSFKSYADDKLMMVGEVPDAAAFLDNKQILIVPLFSGSGIRVKIIEGMALGKTIICTPIAWQGIQCKDRTHLLEAADARSFALAIIKCLEDETFAKQLGINARHCAEENYENKNVTAMVINYYKDLIHERRF
jgi:glycosyltransferase involved in cell wall biosynthesis